MDPEMFFHPALNMKRKARVQEGVSIGYRRGHGMFMALKYSRFIIKVKC